MDDVPKPVELRLSEWTLAILLGAVFGLVGFYVVPLWVLMEVRGRFYYGTWDWKNVGGGRHLAKGYRVTIWTALAVGILTGLARVIL